MYVFIGSNKTSEEEKDEFHRDGVITFPVAP